ncbi:MAG: hypothetical protein EAZ95_08135 [Bacteroidetes bacterium]|nr:MAG: hypothetical protein EAZ95_08135 [Bacteroidota bacterium]
MTSYSLYEAEDLQTWCSAFCMWLKIAPQTWETWVFSKYDSSVFLEHQTSPNPDLLPTAKLMWRKLPADFQVSFGRQEPTIENLSNELAACLHGAGGRQEAICVPIWHQKQPLGVVWFLGESSFLREALAVLLQEKRVITQTLARLLCAKNQERTIYTLQKHNEALETSQQSIHENAVGFLKIHKQLTDSLAYAKKIQQAILPTDNLLRQNFEDFFILFQPKDIVSGDFYWFSQLDYTFLAVVDCTGHGVPGAFMSMIGNTLLNEIVNVKRQNSPAHILGLLNVGIRNALNQEESRNVDGMDMGLCRLERDEDFQLKLTFAGAKNKLYLYQKSSNQIKTLKGNRASLGGNNYEDTYFDETTTLLEPDDVFYLMSDGFADICNERRVAFGSARTVEFLLQNACLPLDTQKTNLQELLTHYQNGTPQRDDITVIGIKP